MSTKEQFDYLNNTGWYMSHEIIKPDAQNKQVFWRHEILKGVFNTDLAVEVQKELDFCERTRRLMETKELIES